MVRAVNRPPSLSQPKRCRRLCCDCKTNGKPFKPTGVPMRAGSRERQWRARE